MANVRDLKMNPPHNRLVGQLPKIGIRPAIDGRRRGVRESLEDQTMAMAQSVATLLTREPAPRQRPAGRMRDCRHLHRRRGRGGADGREVRPRGRGRVAHRDTLLVLWLRDHGHGPLSPKAVWGFNGTERPGAVYLAAVLAAHNQKGLPAFGIYGQDVQDSGDARSPPTCRRSCCGSPAPGWRSPACAASPTWRWAASRWASPARSSTTASSRTTWACGSNRWTWSNSCAAWTNASTTKRSSQRALAWVKENCRGRPRPQPARAAAHARTEGRGLGTGGQDGADRPRPDGRQPAAGRAGLSARKRWGTTPSWPASRASASGPTTSPTAISWRPSSTPPLTGTASASRSWSPPRTTPERHVDAVRPPADRTGRRSSPTCAPTGARRRSSA